MIYTTNNENVIQMNFWGEPDELSVTTSGVRVSLTNSFGETAYGIVQGCNSEGNVLVKMEYDLKTVVVEPAELENASAEENLPAEIPLKLIEHYLRIYPYPGSETINEVLTNGSRYHYEPLYFCMNNREHLLISSDDYDWMMHAGQFPYWRRMFYQFTGVLLPEWCQQAELMDLLLAGKKKERDVSQIEFAI